MKIKLHPDLAEKVLALTNEFGYAPEEIISIGIALAAVLLNERRHGNRVLVVNPLGSKVAEFQEVEPKAVHEIAKQYLTSLCSEMAEISPSLLVARLESQRDAETRQ